MNTHHLDSSINIFLSLIYHIYIYLSIPQGNSFSIMCSIHPTIIIYLVNITDYVPGTETMKEIWQGPFPQTEHSLLGVATNNFHNMGSTLTE